MKGQMSLFDDPPSKKKPDEDEVTVWKNGKCYYGTKVRTSFPTVERVKSMRAAGYTVKLNGKPFKGVTK